tara:strand:+ start:2476 stop:3129 length:654 start_codon:yes stop_codon:yes gene_type:complete
LKNFINIKQLLKFYELGYFPMAQSKNDGNVGFYLPKKRFIIPIKDFHVPKKLFSIFKKQKFEFKINTNFHEVIYQCQTIERKTKGTWINDIILNTYLELHKIQKCHSVECYENNKIVGGLYGVHLGSCFFGESMFSLRSNASKLTLLYLISILIKNEFKLLDSQFYNPHLIQFGAKEIKNETYEILLRKYLKKKNKFENISKFQDALSILQSISHKS